MIHTLFFQPLGPPAILALGGLLLWLVSWLAWRYARARRAIVRLRFRTPLALAAVAVSAWLWLRIGAEPAVHDLSWRWQPLTVAGATIHWQADAWNWFGVLLIVVLAAAVILLDDNGISAMPAAGSAERVLWLAAAAAMFVCSANVITLASSWLILDALLVLCLFPANRAAPGDRAWGLLTMIVSLLLLALVMLGEEGLPASLAGGRFGRQELSLLWILGLMRAGVYPLHFWLTSPGRVGGGAQVAVHLIGPAAGIWLLARVQQLAGPSLAHRPEWAALGVLALLGTALAAWTAEQSEWRWRWIAVNRANVVLLAAYGAGTPGTQAFAWTLASFGLGSALLAVGQAPRVGWRPRLPALIGVLILWGAPGTIGFLAHSALIFPTELAIAAPLFGVMLVAEILLIAALWQSLWGSDDGLEPVAGAHDASPAPSHLAIPFGTQVRRSLATILLAAPAIAWGLFPQHLASLGAFAPPDGALTVGQVIAAARRSVWIGLAASAVGGVALGVGRVHILGRLRGWQRGISEVVSLEWLYRAVVSGLRLVGSGLQYFARLGEGEGYLGWLALAGLILWVLLRG